MSSTYIVSAILWLYPGSNYCIDMYAYHSLPPLAMINLSVFPELFCQPCRFVIGKMTPIVGSKFAVGT